MLRVQPEGFWVKRGEKMTLKLFNEMSRRVPAYRDFLKKNSIDAGKIKTIADFKQVPAISKDSYLKKNDLQNLCWDGVFSDCQWDISSTSGSTGVPYYFPRQDDQNAQYALLAELYLLNNFSIDRRTTLYVNCFALGVWIGGLFTYEALKMVSRRGGYSLSIINPGLNKSEILKAIKQIGGNFDQVIIGGYPPFVKDVIDEGRVQGLNWSDFNIKFVFSAEGFSEDFRDYVSQIVGSKNIYLDSLNHYGTVDQGTLAHETPLTTMIRRLAIKDERLYRAIFKERVFHLPTLAQYLPEMFFFEEDDGGVICSSQSGLPLARYDLKDSGGVIGFHQMAEIFASCGYDFMGEINKAGIRTTLWSLPFVYVYERQDLSVSFSGANVYPETIKKVLIESRFSDFLTGKFTMVIDHDNQQNPSLVLNIEKKNGVTDLSSAVIDMLKQGVVDRLLMENSEYKIIYQTHRQPGGAAPVIKLWEYDSAPYFSGGGKQKWVLKS